MKTILYLFVTVFSTLSFAQDKGLAPVNSELDGIKGEIKALKRQVKELNTKAESEKKQAIEEAQKAVGSEQANFPVIAVKGAVEVEASSRQSYHGSYTDDILNFTAMMGANAQVHELVAADLSLLYEEDSTDLEVDEAYITYGSTESLYLKGGKIYLPLAAMNSGFVSDSFTRTLTEIRESSLLAGINLNGLNFETFVFHGDATKPNKGKRIRDFGASLLYQFDLNNLKITPRLGYLKNAGDIDAIQTALTDVDGDESKNDLGKYSRALTASLGFEIASFNFFAEWAKLQSFRKEDLAFKNEGASPTAFTLEAAYRLPVAGISLSPMLGYQSSKESVKVELPKTRMLAGLNLAINEQAGIVYEYNKSKDYSTSDCDVTDGTCGSSKKSSAHIVKLSASF